MPAPDWLVIEEPSRVRVRCCECRLQTAAFGVFNTSRVQEIAELGGWRFGNYADGTPIAVCPQCQKKEKPK